MFRCLAASSVVLALVAVGCGGADETGCTQLREPEDPLSAQHVVDEGAFSYLSDPPTSGPHLAIDPPVGVFDEPLAGAIQVRILEQGGAIVHYDPEVVDPAAVEGLATGPVVVTPGEDLDAPVVVTAWTWKLTCDHVAAERISDFVTKRSAEAPEA